MVRGALPSFTNVNNASITTGMPPAVTGFGGNFFIEPETGEEVMMNSSKYLRCGTILAAAAKAGCKVAMVTAKNKLLDILSHELEGIAFSSEFANKAEAEIEAPAATPATDGASPFTPDGQAPAAPAAPAPAAAGGSRG